MYYDGYPSYELAWFLFRSFFKRNYRIRDELGGKKELFKFPFGTYFRWMGGAPLDRTGGLNKVDSIASMFKERDVFRLAIAPEGTRKK